MRACGLSQPCIVNSRVEELGVSTLMKNMAITWPCCSLQFLGIFSLDDRPVRESERKASQLHFASEDSLDSKQSCSALTVGRYGLLWFYSDEFQIFLLTGHSAIRHDCLCANCPWAISMHSRWKKFTVLIGAQVDGGWCRVCLLVSSDVPSILPVHFEQDSCCVDSHTREHCILDLLVSLGSLFPLFCCSHSGTKGEH